MLIDDNAVVAAVVDWGNACILPWESLFLFCNFPVRMGVNWARKHTYLDWVWRELMEEQECFLEVARKLEKEDGIVPKISELIHSDEVGTWPDRPIVAQSTAISDAAHIATHKGR
jgi:hypothetical protein